MSIFDWIINVIPSEQIIDAYFIQSEMNPDISIDNESPEVRAAYAEHDAASMENFDPFS